MINDTSLTNRFLIHLSGEAHLFYAEAKLQLQFGTSKNRNLFRGDIQFGSRLIAARPLNRGVVRGLSKVHAISEVDPGGSRVSASDSLKDRESASFPRPPDEDLPAEDRSVT